MVMSPSRLKKLLSGRPTLFERVIVYAGSFDPPALHHVRIVEMLSKFRDKCLKLQPDVPVRILVWPLGAYETKQQVADNQHRRNMARIAFFGIPGVEFDFRDLESGIGYTSTYQMQNILAFEPRTDLRESFLVPLHVPGVLREVYHVIGADNVPKIRTWNEGHDLWTKSRFIVLPRKGYELTELPKNSFVLDPEIPGSSSDVRTYIASGERWEHLVPRLIQTYCMDHELYLPTSVGAMVMRELVK